jgi:hypothetical protein
MPIVFIIKYNGVGALDTHNLVRTVIESNSVTVAHETHLLRNFLFP